MTDQEVEKGRWYPDPPPLLPGEGVAEWSERVTGFDGTNRIPYDHRRDLACALNQHERCPDNDAGIRTCQCPHHEGRWAVLTAMRRETDNARSAADGLSVLAAQYAEDLTVEEACTLLLGLRAAVTTLRDVETAYERWIYEIFRDQGWKTGHTHPRTIAGVGLVEASKSSRTVHDSDGLIKAWFEAWMTAREGDLSEPWDLITALAQATGLIVAKTGSYSAGIAWRKTPLKELGIDPGDYADTTWGAPHVRITEGDVTSDV